MADAWVEASFCKRPHRGLAVRKRRTEIDPLVGTVTEIAQRAGIETPALRMLIHLVHDIEIGRRELSWNTFKVLLDECERKEIA